jgi:hypothetical protein
MGTSIKSLTGAIIAALLACRPVIALGWQEIAIIFVLGAILLGPPVYRFYQRLIEARRGKTLKGKDDES